MFLKDYWFTSSHWLIYWFTLLSGWQIDKFNQLVYWLTCLLCDRFWRFGRWPGFRVHPLIPITYNLEGFNQLVHWLTCLLCDRFYPNWVRIEWSTLYREHAYTWAYFFSNETQWTIKDLNVMTKHPSPSHGRHRNTRSQTSRNWNTMRRGKSVQTFCAQTREKNDAPTSNVLMGT